MKTKNIITIVLAIVALVSFILYLICYREVTRYTYDCISTHVEIGAKIVKIDDDNVIFTNFYGRDVYKPIASKINFSTEKIVSEGDVVDILFDAKIGKAFIVSHLDRDRVGEKRYFRKYRDEIDLYTCGKNIFGYTAIISIVFLALFYAYHADKEIQRKKEQ